MQGVWAQQATAWVVDIVGLMSNMPHGEQSDIPWVNVGTSSCWGKDSMDSTIHVTHPTKCPDHIII